ncbi:MAG: L,D-transpeptidase family protein [Candidatus Competibacter sp.]|nr:L,D-transpeptidase family protein [Candidatus Competibacter sp.]
MPINRIAIKRFVVSCRPRVLAGFGVCVRSPLSSALLADRIVVYKAERELLLVAEGKTLKRYRIALGGRPQGHKTQEGDRRTPEGVYRIAGRNPRSAYHLSLRINYPNEDDRIQAASRGVSPGGDIMIHGLPNGFGWVGRLHRWVDWTAGCIAVTDSEIEEIWRAVSDGTPVEIKPCAAWKVS